ncbi:MAG TPA: hypothetical protein VF247_03190 [Candidatus Krumholzibacteria bacterium]
MKPCSVACSSGLRALAALLVLAPACAPRHDAGSTRHGAEACAQVDSFFARSLPRPLEMRGHATFDVDTYRVRGRFQLRLAPGGDASLEFSGATLLGGHREDVAVSLTGDTLRVLDRERGRYYEGADVEEMMANGTRTPGEWLLGLRRVLASGCPGVESVRAGEDGLSGSAADGTFDLRAPSGRLEEATWPNPAPEETFRDRLEVRYHWKNGRMDGIEARLPTRGWRVRLDAD